MPIAELQVDRLRCLDQLKIEPHPELNIIAGANGAGKTSLLEAIYLLGRGRSFRSPRPAAVVQTGAPTATLFCRLSGKEEPDPRLGISIGRQKTEIHINAKPGGSVADLVSALPVLLIDSEVHQLIQGGPSERRRFLDWGVFHVKHDFRRAWRTYRRALQQRNAALKQGQNRSAVEVWNPDLIAAALVVDSCRREYLDALKPHLLETIADFLNLPAGFTLRSGWPQEADLAAALHEGYPRDSALGSTQLGPHRAELVISVDGHPARHRLSRGQQKLCAAALILAQSRFVLDESQQGMTLLVDEPAAELDDVHLRRLLAGVRASSAQVFITALDPDALGLSGDRRVFHVEHGGVRILV